MMPSPHRKAMAPPRIKRGGAPPPDDPLFSSAVLNDYPPAALLEADDHPAALAAAACDDATPTADADEAAPPQLGTPDSLGGERDVRVMIDLTGDDDAANASGGSTNDAVGHRTNPPQHPPPPAPPPPPPPPVSQSDGDVVDYVRTEMDGLLSEIYVGEYVHDNDGSHITRTIPGSKAD